MLRGETVDVRFPDGIVRKIEAQINVEQRSIGVGSGLEPVAVPGWYFVLLLDGSWFAIATDRDER